MTIQCLDVACSPHVSLSPRITHRNLYYTNDIPFVSRLLQAVGSTHKRPAAHFRTSPVDSYSSPSYLTLTERSLGSRQVDRSESKHRVQRPSWPMDRWWRASFEPRSIALGIHTEEGREEWFYSTQPSLHYMKKTPAIPRENQETADSHRE